MFRKSIWFVAALFVVSMATISFAQCGTSGCNDKAKSGAGCPVSGTMKAGSETKPLAAESKDAKGCKMDAKACKHGSDCKDCKDGKDCKDCKKDGAACKHGSDCKDCKDGKDCKDCKKDGAACKHGSDCKDCKAGKDCKDCKKDGTALKHGSDCKDCKDGKACGECTMKAGEKKETAKMAEKLPDGIVEGNVYLLADGEKRFICPVMLNQANVKDASGFADYQGKRYYFCCGGCDEKFAKETKKFVDALVIPANIVKMDGKKAVAVCPVTKEEVTVDRKTNYVDLGGKRYYVCCKDCVGKLTKNPDEYVKSAPK